MEVQKMGLMINYDKTKYMETVKPTKEKYIRINKRDIDKVNQFKYLGSIITNNNNITSGKNHRLTWGINAVMDCKIYWDQSCCRKIQNAKFIKH
jgi:hypothetical protein